MTVFVYTRGAEQKTYRIIVSEEDLDVQFLIPNISFTGFSPQYSIKTAVVEALKFHKNKLKEFGLIATELSSIMVYNQYTDGRFTCRCAPANNDYLREIIRK